MMGMQKTELFDPPDLFENKNMGLVLKNLANLKFLQNKKGNDGLGETFTQAKLRQAADRQAELDAALAPKTQRCSQCHQELKAQARFCPSCGASVGTNRSENRGGLARHSSVREIRTAPTETAERPSSARNEIGIHSRSGSSSDAFSFTPGRKMVNTRLSERDMKYDPELEGQARRWIEKLLGEVPHADNQELPTSQFIDVVKSGVILCKVMNAVNPEKAISIYGGVVIMKQMENIEKYLHACAEFGFAKAELFTGPDIIGAQPNMPLVHCL